MRILKNHNLRLLGLAFLLALISYATILNSFFISDDFVHIGKVLEGEFSATWGLEQGGFFRPLYILSYVVDGTLWGTKPFGYHLTNVALHAFNSFLVFTLSSRLIRSNGNNSALSFRISAAAGLIFLLHPSHSEAVSWISGRADLMATLFFLTALIFYDSYRQERSSTYLALFLTLFILALLAKESALCLPFVIIAIELSSASDQRRDFKRALRVGLLLCLVLLVYFLIRYAAIGKFIGAYGTGQQLDFKFSLIWERLPKYFVRAVLPPLPEQLTFMFFKPFKSSAFGIFALVFTGVLSTLLVLRHKWQSHAKRKQQNVLLSLLLILFLCSLVPVITMGIGVFDTSGERFVYLPSVFTSIAIGYIAATFISNRNLWIASIFCLLIFYSGSLYRSNQKWREASDLSNSILSDLASLARQDDLLIINAPDNLRGVPVYRNGLEQALKTFQSFKKIGHVDVVSSHSLQSKTDAVIVAHESRLFSIRLLNEKDEFSRINDHVACIRITEHSKNSLIIELQDCGNGIGIFYFHEGEMIDAAKIE